MDSSSGQPLLTSVSTWLIYQLTLMGSPFTSFLVNVDEPWKLMRLQTIKFFSYIKKKKHLFNVGLDNLHALLTCILPILSDLFQKSPDCCLPLYCRTATVLVVKVELWVPVITVSLMGWLPLKMSNCKCFQQIALCCTPWPPSRLFFYSA